MKEDKKRIGYTDLGIPIYAVDCNGGAWKTPRLEVFVDEVEKIAPEAVSSINDFKIINYGLLK